MANEQLQAAKTAKNDEFYTQLSEIQEELGNYTDKFENKVVFCNCDDPFESNFVKYFLMNFNRLKLKELIATGYKTSFIRGSEIGDNNLPYALRVKGTSKYLIGTQKDLDLRGAKLFLESEGNNVITPLNGNPAIDNEGKQIQVSLKKKYVDKKTGKERVRTIKQDLFYEAGDFRSDMSVELLKQSDIVVTNCPFSLFREYVAQLIEYDKKFLIIGNMNAITYKEFFPLIKDNKVWVGYGFNRSFIYQSPYKNELESNRKFVKSKGYDPDKHIKVPACCWFTNLDHKKRHTILPIDLGYKYEGHKNMYPKYETYDAIDVAKVSEIPCDYTGVMGVPKSFMAQYCPEQFKILGYERDDENICVGIKNMPKSFLEDYKKQGGTGHYTSGMKMLCFYDSKGKTKIPFSRILIQFTDTYIEEHPEQFMKEDE